MNTEVDQVIGSLKLEEGDLIGKILGPMCKSFGELIIENGNSLKTELIKK